MDEEQLKIILKQHKLWLESKEKEGVRADLSDANLISANLQFADLRNANLRDANFKFADLRGADLDEANTKNTTIIKNTD